MSLKHVAAALLCANAVMVAGTAQAEWAAGGGVEAFRWRESTTPRVKETGMRWALDLQWTQSREPGLSAGYKLHFYTGNVDYDGAGLFTGTPLSGETRYRGMVNEFQAYYRTQTNLDVMLALGWDRWDRRLSAAQEESFDVVYAKAGMQFNASVKQGVIGSVGLKYPVHVREDANFPDIGGLTNPRLRPKEDLSFYGTVGYRSAPWEVAAYYDSYRFRASNTVAVPLAAGGTGVFFQPESKMDVYGVKFLYNF